MKKKIFGLAAALLLTVGLAACGNNSDSKDSANKADDTTLKVGASPTMYYRTNLWKKATLMPITSSIFLI